MYESSDLIELSTESFNNKEVLELPNSLSGKFVFTLIGFWVIHILFCSYQFHKRINFQLHSED